MTRSSLLSVLIAASAFVSSAACGSTLLGRWALAVENSEHRAIATLKVEFTDETAKSCLGGDWKVVKVVSASTLDENFFPTSYPLAYRIENQQLTIGRNEECDAYLLLEGALNGPSVTGKYRTLGQLGSSQLGYFSLRQSF